MRWFVVIVFALGACHAVTPAEEAQDVCRTICACGGAGLPATETECMQACQQQVSSPSDACMQCTFDNEQSCAVVIGECVKVCVQSTNPPQGGN